MDPFKQSQLKYRSYLDSVRHMYDRPIAQTSTTLIVTLVTIAFFGLAAIRPSLGVISKLQAEVRDKRELNSQLGDKVSDLASVVQEYKTNRELLSAFERAIPDNQNLERLVLSLDFLAQRNQVLILNSRTGSLVAHGPVNTHYSDGEPFPSFNVDLNVGGSYANLLDLLADIQNLDRYVVVQRVSFGQPATQDVAYEMTMNLRMRVYWSEESD